MATRLTGREEFILSLNALPRKYKGISDRFRKEAKGMSRFGGATERVVSEVLKSEGLAVNRPGPIFEDEGYIRPDLYVQPLSYIEIKKWGDSNKLGSAIAQGLFLKAKLPKSKYYVVVASYGVPDSWTEEEDVDFYLDGSRTILNIHCIDGYFGFPNIDHLVKELKTG